MSYNIGAFPETPPLPDVSLKQVASNHHHESIDCNGAATTAPLLAFFSASLGLLVFHELKDLKISIVVACLFAATSFYVAASKKVFVRIPYLPASYVGFCCTAAAVSLLLLMRREALSISQMSLMIGAFFSALIIAILMRSLAKRQYSANIFLAAFQAGSVRVQILSIISTGMITLLLVIGIGSGHTLYDSKSAEFLLYACPFVAGAISGINFRACSANEFRSPIVLLENARKICLLIALIVFVLLAWRSDFLAWVDGSIFHWQYYVGPAAEYQSGVLREAANQYSWLAAYISGILSDSPWRGIYYLQAWLLTALVFSAILITWRGNWKQTSFSICFCFLLLLSDPSSAGPQSFPSSSVLRFMPAYIYCLAIFINSKYSKCSKPSLASQVPTLLALVIGMAWSPDSLAILIVSLLITLACKLFKIIFLDKSVFVWPRQLKSDHLILVMGSFLGISIFAWLFNMTEYYKYVSGYIGSKYGWVEPEGLICLSLIFALAIYSFLYFLSQKGSMNSCLALAAIGMIIGYVSYRPISNNVTAVLPLAMAVALTIHYDWTRKGDTLIMSTAEKLYSFGLIYFESIVVSLGSVALVSSIGQLLNVNELRDHFRSGTTNVGSARLLRYINEDCDQNAKRLNELLTAIGIINKKHSHFLSNEAITLVNGSATDPNVGSCFLIDSKRWSPIVLQPPQLYLEPIEEKVGIVKINRMLARRNIDRLFVLSETDQVSSRLELDFLKRFGPKWIIPEKRNFVYALGQIYGVRLIMRNPIR